jgi:hypothetical protein
LLEVTESLFRGITGGHPDQFDLGPKCPPESRAEQPRPLRVFEGAMAN